MAKKLSHEDSQAVDLFLNGGHGLDGQPLGSTFVNHGKTHVAERLESIEKVLSLIAQMPAPEPAADLLSRTLARIEEVEGHETVDARRPGTHRPAAGNSRQHA